MSDDIRSVLSAWPFSAEELKVRLIVGDDGREQIQMRLDLGLLQMEVDGRPDGQLVRGFPSWLDLHAKLQSEYDSQNPDGAPYLLESEDCAELMREGVQYYHRYVAFWQLEKYELCARDTRRNLRLFEFVRDHARYDRDKLQFEQWRPYVTMMHTRAVATPLLEMGLVDAALGAIDAGIEGIHQFLSDYGQDAESARLGELMFLRRWRREVLRSAGRRVDAEGDDDPDDDPLLALRSDLERAIAEERYEEAARLRDELTRLEEPPPPGALGA